MACRDVRLHTYYLFFEDNLIPIWLIVWFHKFHKLDDWESSWDVSDTFSSISLNQLNIYCALSSEVIDR